MYKPLKKFKKNLKNFWRNFPIYLKGIGYIKKIGKNKIEWLFDDLYTKNIIEEEDETKRLNKELELINSKENEIDKCLLESKKYFDSVSENQNFKEFGYVTYEDIKSLIKGEDVNLIAVKAPSGTSLDIPDPNHITKIYNEVQKVK